MSKLSLLALVVSVSGIVSPSAVAAEPVVVSVVDGAADAFARYTAAQNEARPWRVETVEIEASLPKLSKHGRLRAIRKLLPVGRPQYQVLEITGDQVVKSEVIARYLSEDIRTAQIPAATVSITPANYKFRYKGVAQNGDSATYFFSITPRKKREGLIKGELWLDGATGIAVRQSGYLVKRASILVKRVDVAREIQLSGGIARMRVTHLSIDTRLAGRAELTIEERPYTASDEGGVAGQPMTVSPPEEPPAFRHLPAL
ncbi:MAG: hypothetical protein ACLQU1_30225 [Bryobacteraceae bacterium]